MSPGRGSGDARWVLVVVLPCIAGAVAFVGPRSVAAGEPSVSTSRARTIFLADCAVCHGNRGQGSETGPSLRGRRRRLRRLLGVDRAHAVVDPSPRSPDRPEDAEVLARGDQAALVQYVTQLTGGGGLPIPEVSTHGDAARGGELYRLNCAACHSWSGTGGALEDREAPNLFRATPTQIARSGPRRSRRDAGVRRGCDHQPPARRRRRVRPRPRPPERPRWPAAVARRAARRRRGRRSCSGWARCWSSLRLIGTRT